MKKEIIIYTDGACSGNPGPGGWAAVLQYKDRQKEISGYEEYTTNQRMELIAAVEALSALKEPCRVKLNSDSAYLVNAFKQRWLEKWQKNNWLNAQKRPVENKDLWHKLLNLSLYHEIEWIKVKGHSDNSLNNRCDELAKKEINKHNLS